MKSYLPPFLLNEAIIVLVIILTFGCSKRPPYCGEWTNLPEGVSATVKTDGTLSVFFTAVFQEMHSGTYRVSASNANEIVLTLDIDSSTHRQSPIADAGLASGTVKWSKNANGKERLIYSYTHRGGHDYSYALERPEFR